MANLWAATAQDVTVERVLLEQSMHLAKQPYHVKVWIASRQIFQQQALLIHVQLTANDPAALPTLAVASQADPAWLAPMVSPEPSLTQQAGKTVAQWQIRLFAKQAGINALPNLRLQWIGASLSRHTHTLPSWSIKVLPLPIYVPEQAIVAESVDLQTPLPLPRFALVDEVMQRQLVFRLGNHLPNSLWLPSLQSDAIEPLSPWLQAGDARWQGEDWVSEWQLWQPWRLTQAGYWQVEAQDIWVFNPTTWQVTHLQIPAYDGWAIPLWLWRSLQGLMLILVLSLSYAVLAWMRCRLNRHHYRQAIQQCADAAQLYTLMVKAWRLTPHISLAHQAPSLPIYPILVALENHLFSQAPLYHDTFKHLQADLLSTDQHYPCTIWYSHSKINRG
jgi:hypothetical protein